MRAYESRCDSENFIDELVPILRFTLAAVPPGTRSPPIKGHIQRVKKGTTRPYLSEMPASDTKLAGLWIGSTTGAVDVVVHVLQLMR
jgi:hypothetical protein